MEANFVLKASDLTAEFAEGLRKVSNNATLYIRVEFESGSKSSTSNSGNVLNGRGLKKRGRKPGATNKNSSDYSISASGASNDSINKRGRKPASENKTSKVATSEGPKKRGRKPKNQLA